MLDNKLLDIFHKHQVFYIMGIFYGGLFFIIGLLLMHPTIGLPNTVSNPTRLLGWISYCAIESFGSIVVQCYWALVNASVDVEFAKKNFGVIIAGAQIGSIIGPTIATQAEYISVPILYLGGSMIMFFMIGAMYLYIERFGIVIEEEDNQPDQVGAMFSTKLDQNSKNNKNKTAQNGPEKGILEGFYLLYEHDYVKVRLYICIIYTLC